MNVYGDSVQSPTGTGAVIQLVPDAPISLTNDFSTTTDTTIKFSWSPGASDGGTAVIDHSIYYDQATEDFIELASGVVDLHYQTSISLTPGLFYKFKVTARNTVGSSLYSEEISILAAKVPDAPINLVNVPAVTTAYQVGLSWQDGPYNGGSPVIDY